jgi:hypothetical protein
VTFTIDVSQLGGVLPADVQIFRDGTALANCTDAVAAVPDACVASRLAGVGGDAVVTVRTSHFSTWNPGRLAYGLRGFAQPVDDFPVANRAKAGVTIPVRFSLTGNRGLSVFAAGSPSVEVGPCPSTKWDAIEETVPASTALLSYNAKTDLYTYALQTQKSWLGCRTLTLRFRDGSSKKAAFDLTK